VAEVSDKTFPEERNYFGMKDEEFEQLKEMLHRSEYF
jgi:hypothetical protein